MSKANHLRNSTRPAGPGHPRGAAAVEMALFLPLLTFLLVATVDFARLFYAYTTITNCARNGALYASDATAAADSPYADYRAAAIADGANLSPALTTSNVSMASGSDAGGAYVAVTVTYNFPMITSYLGFSNKTISRTVWMRVAPATPN